jgi:tRNA N6-adenosine threonylcarbamoyltransferase
MKILAIESSCDETSAAICENGEVLSNIISSQHFHGKFGGVVPELASRAHLDAISHIVEQSLSESNTEMKDVDALAVTSEPGLIGSLIVGSSFAKGLSIKFNLPIIPINHIEGHLFSGCLQDPNLKFPFITLVVSGGHTALFFVESYNKYEIMGLTKDDAAGEAFDKIAKLMGLTYPGGPLIDKLSKEGDPKAYDFPRSMINSKDLNFSFSGLKTSVRYYIHNNFPDGIPEEEMANMCASVQEAIVDVLVKKTIEAAKIKRVKSIVIGGGVSANSRLRHKLEEAANKRRIALIAPEMAYCMDNAAMIGFLAEKKMQVSNKDLYRSLTYRVSSNALRAKR